MYIHTATESVALPLTSVACSLHGPSLHGLSTVPVAYLLCQWLVYCVIGLSTVLVACLLYQWLVYCVTGSCLLNLYISACLL